MNRYIISDLHLGHDNICNFRKRFSSAEDHHNTLLENLKSIQGKRVWLFLLGDIAFTKEWLDEIKKLTFGQKILYLGNHDTPKSITMQDIASSYDEVYSLASYKGYWLSHCPIHPQEFWRRNLNVHGHTHSHLILNEEGVPDPRYRSVCVEYAGLKPITFEHACSGEYFEECVDKWREV